MNENESIAKCQEKSFGEKLNTWVQTVGILIASIIASIWGIYAFIYKEIIIPKSAPVNVTLELSLNKRGMCGIKESKQPGSLVALEMKVTAKNPSSRTVYLLPSAFIVFGYHVAISHLENGDFLREISENKITSKPYPLKLKHVNISKGEVVAVGKLLVDDALKPKELVGRCFLIYVPQGEYDMLRAVAIIPCAKYNSGIRLEWEYKKDENAIIQKLFYKPSPTLWLVSGNGKEHEIEKDKNGEYIIGKKFEYQCTTSMSMISLWEAPTNFCSKLR
jgi:hypothetical protein